MPVNNLNMLLCKSIALPDYKIHILIQSPRNPVQILSLREDS